MHDFVRLALLLGIAASALTVAGSAVAYWTDEPRRLARLAWRALGGEPDGMIIAQGRDAGAAMRLASGQILVMRDGGANALLYKLPAFMGAELSVDDEIVARVARGETKRSLERTPKDAQQVVLRLLFDDPKHPEFALDLWLPMDEFRRNARPANVMIQEARTWLNRADTVLRRTQGAFSAKPARPSPEPPPVPAFEPPPVEAWDDEPDDLAATEHDAPPLRTAVEPHDPHAEVAPLEDDLDPFSPAPETPAPRKAARRSAEAAEQLPLL